MKINHFPKNVIENLKNYVYIYSDPITEKIFYVGKGKGNRAFDHLKDKNECEKVDYLNALLNKGLQPKIEILIHGIEDDSVLRIESAIIDLLGIVNLTNKQTGFKSAEFGRMTVQQIISAYSKQKVDIEEPSILIRINQEFRYSMTDMELYDFTRGYWKINVSRAQTAKYAFAVYNGIIQEVYAIKTWLKAGESMNIRGRVENIDDRVEFIGNIAEEEIRQKYKFKSVESFFRKGNANPIMYINC
jgi:hypothetical protein